MTKKNKKNPVCAIWWNDASYVFQKEKPDKPLPILTVGFIIETNDEFTNIATDVEYNEETQEVIPSRGVLIPKKSIIKFKKINYLNE